MDTVSGSATRDLFVDIDRMLAECLAEDCTGTLAEASDVSVRDKGALFKPIESLSREHRFQGVVLVEVPAALVPE
jgi:hypothetical protein